VVVTNTCREKESLANAPELLVRHLGVGEWRHNLNRFISDVSTFNLKHKVEACLFLATDSVLRGGRESRKNYVSY
jgi:hypothetical protein